MPGASTFRDSKVLENMVKKHVEKGKLYAAVCAAPAVALGAWGLLNGLKVILSPVIHFLYALYYHLSFG
jgi:4-methyl-5(b-hydroxyethyl)-thiazole monophosphate biosynthesis